MEAKRFWAPTLSGPATFLFFLFSYDTQEALNAPHTPPGPPAAPHRQKKRPGSG